MDNVIDIGYTPVDKKKVLVVDDENSLQTLIFDTLEAEYRVIPAFNGRDGVAKARNLRPDMILMDVMMPDVSGYDAVRLLQEDASTRQIPVVVITAQDFDVSTIQMIKREPNVVAFISKPFRAQALRDMVKSVIDKRKST